MNDAEFAKFKDELIGTAKEINEASSDKRPVPTRGPDGKFLKRDAKGATEAQPAPVDRDAPPKIIEPATGPKKPDAEPAPAAADDFSADLVEEAAALGLSKDDFPTPASLEKAVRALDKTLLAKFGSQAKPAEQVKPAQEPLKPVEPAKPAAPPEDALTKAMSRLESFEPEWANAIRDVISASSAADKAEIAELKKLVGGVAQQRASEHSQAVINAFDDALERNPQYQEFLGQGRFQERQRESTGAGRACGRRSGDARHSQDLPRCGASRASARHPVQKGRRRGLPR